MFDKYFRAKMAESSAKTESKPTAADAESQYKATLMKKEKFRYNCYFLLLRISQRMKIN